ncbi:carbohydrate ABC transporter permease [Actinomyces bowdenii]|uniref:Carbohydrate ABC transporter permease n=2 Tax=Actinomyces bowdenii TaxID=131109 RepID=A0A853EIS2_9ACTO|nr:carbohydrate ABC transporter permease [Actinomyces bowdenii]MBF0696287.1 carbohydrate ABC transporter permease [Actinomyces bowdenii]MDO5064155.1 carbohydrate ABC transporter permease [Actinomyces bowdenii]NYS68460.1 carbohydrate ABC transporter permease [Actinomyces bowdenii]
MPEIATSTTSATTAPATTTPAGGAGPAPIHQGPRLGARLRRGPIYVFLTICSVASVFPLFFMVVSATNTSNDVLASRLLPGSHFMDNLRSLASTTNLVPALGYSAAIALATTVLALLVCSLAGYGFEIYHSRAKDAVMAVLLLAMMIPFAATMIPLFRLFAGLGMINSLWAVVIPAVSTPFLILLFRQASRSFPHEVLEAARLDGLSEIGIFLRIYVPTMKSTYAAAAVVTFMTAWNNFLWPRIILVDSDVQTMPLLISNLSAGYITNYGVLMLAVLLASLPAMIVFLALQRSFANGIMGALK